MGSKPTIWDFRRGIATARVLTQLGHEHGLTFDAMQRNTGLTRALLDDPKAEIEAMQEIALIRNLVTDLKHIPTLGIQAGGRYHLTTYGLWGYAVMSSPTLGSAVSMASRMLNLTFSLTSNVIERVGPLIHSTYHTEHLPPDVRQFIIDRDRAAVVTLQRDVLGHPLPFQAILMRGPEPSPAMVAAYTALFGIRPLFGQQHDRNVFEASVMNEPLPQADPHTAQLCEQMCRDLMEKRHARTGVAASVRDRLLRTPGHIPDMEEIATDLRITSRTLRRHLTAEGATFRGLLEEVRRTLTEELMASASLTHSEIAERLGYADVTTFIEAFRRWKGMAPSEYRRGQGISAPMTRLARSRLNGKNTG